MSRNTERLAARLLLPEIPVGQELAGVTTGLQFASGEIAPALINEVSPDLVTRSNANGTIDIVNVSGGTIAAGRVLTVTAAQVKDTPFPDDEIVVTAVPTPQTAANAREVMYAFLGFTAVPPVIAANSANLVPWNYSIAANFPLVAGGFISITAAGEIQILKAGDYIIQQNLQIIRAAGAAAGRVSLALGLNGTVSGSNRVAQDYSGSNEVLSFARQDFFRAPIPATLSFHLVTPANDTTFNYGMGVANSFVASRLLITRYPS